MADLKHPGGVKVSTKYLVLYNQGFGIATNVRAYFEGVGAPVPYRNLAIKDETAFKIPDDAAGGQLTLLYFDMFGNEYITCYVVAGNLDAYGWQPPENLQPSELRNVARDASWADSDEYRLDG